MTAGQNSAIIVCKFFCKGGVSPWPTSTKNPDYPQLNRRITSYEYNKVVDTALELGMTDGFMQQKSSAKEEYTPPFNLEGL